MESNQVGQQPPSVDTRASRFCNSLRMLYIGIEDTEWQCCMKSKPPSLISSTRALV